MQRHSELKEYRELIPDLSRREINGIRKLKGIGPYRLQNMTEDALRKIAGRRFKAVSDLQLRVRKAVFADRIIEEALARH